MKVRSGSIPKELIYILAAPQEIKITWDDTDAEEGDAVKAETVFPVFVSDATNKGTLSTGRTWAKNTETRHEWVMVNGQQTSVVKQVWSVVEKSKKNEPMKKLRIFGLAYRYNGGRAWKCADSEGHYFDLREDVLLDLMRTVGVSEGGYLNGEYIWAKVGSEMKIVRVDSDLHKALINSTARREMKAFSKKELQPMHVYAQKNGEAYLYLGVGSFMHTSRENYDPEVERRFHSWAAAVKNPNGWEGQNYLRTYRTMTEPTRPTPIKFNLSTVSDHVWIELDSSWNDSKSREENLTNLLAKKSEFLKMVVETTWHKEFTQHALNSKVLIGPSFKVVDDLGNLDIPEIWDQIRGAALYALNKPKDPNVNQSNHRIVIERQRLTETAALTTYGTIRPKDEPLEDAYDYWATALLSAEPA